jgi:hypothetical protein
MLNCIFARSDRRPAAIARLAAHRRHSYFEPTAPRAIYWTIFNRPKLLRVAGVRQDRQEKIGYPHACELSRSISLQQGGLGTLVPAAESFRRDALRRLDDLNAIIDRRRTRWISTLHPIAEYGLFGPRNGTPCAFRRIENTPGNFGGHEHTTAAALLKRQLKADLIRSALGDCRRESRQAIPRSRRT